MKNEAENSFIERMKKEYEELLDKFKKLEAFVESDKFSETVKDDYHEFLLKTQKAVMERYLQILECRMGRLKPEYDGCEEIAGMSFGIAILALNEGYPVKRKGWANQNECVIKQVPSHIKSDAIEGLQSLPQKAKDMILGSKGEIDYNHQLLLYNKETGKANNYIPSVEDIFFHDWKIVLAEI